MVFCWWCGCGVSCALNRDFVLCFPCLVNGECTFLGCDYCIVVSSHKCVVCPLPLFLISGCLDLFGVDHLKRAPQVITLTAPAPFLITAEASSLMAFRTGCTSPDFQGERRYAINAAAVSHRQEQVLGNAYVDNSLLYCLRVVHYAST